MGADVVNMQEKSCGQGCCVKTIKTGSGYNLPVIRCVPYSDENIPRKDTCGRKKGLRPMHATTMNFASNVLQIPSKETYLTTHKEFHSGKKHLPRPEMRQSMRTQQWTNVKFAEEAWSQDDTFESHYKYQYCPKTAIPFNQSHQISAQTSERMKSGVDVKAAFTAEDGPPNYRSQYSRIHSHLGKMLGPGQPRPCSVRQSYNVLTGEPMGAAWRPNNELTSLGRKSCDFPLIA